MPVRRRKVRGKLASTWTARFEYRGRVYQRGKFADKATALHWETQERAKLSRGEVGYVAINAALPVGPLIEGYYGYLLTLGRDSMYAYNTEKRLERVRDEATWLTLGDVTAASFETWRSSKPKWKSRVLGAKTLNQYLDTLIGFGAWLVGVRRVLPVNPFPAVQPVRAVQNVDVRRPATIEELERLLATAPADRALLYRFLVYCPLRRAAFEGLTWRMLSLDSDTPHVLLPPALNKTRTPLLLPIRRDVAELLAKRRGDADDKVFPAVSIRTWRSDLAAAGIAYDEGHGRLDLHAIRMTAVSLMADAGVDFEEVHRMLGHSSRSTTERWYYRGRVKPRMTAAAERMPTIGGGK